MLVMCDFHLIKPGRKFQKIKESFAEAYQFSGSERHVRLMHGSVSIHTFADESGIESSAGCTRNTCISAMLLVAM